MKANSPVFCEKLIAVEDPGRSNWWRALLPEGHEPIFETGGRFESVDQPNALIRSVEASRKGFKPILLCPTVEARKALGQAFQEARKPGRFLVRGYDNRQITNLLLHPSSEVLLGLAGRRKLLAPNKVYREALDTWVTNDRASKLFLEKVEQKPIRLADFRLIEEPEDTITSPRREFKYEWKIDPAVRLTLLLFLNTHQAVLKRNDEWPERAAGLIIDDQVVKFDDKKVKLEADQLKWMVEHLELPAVYADWDDVDHGPTLHPTVKKKFDEWWKTDKGLNTDTIKDSHDVSLSLVYLSPGKWLLVAGTLAHVARGGIRIRGPKSAPTPVEANKLKTPFLTVAEDDPSLVFEVNWNPPDRNENVVPKIQPVVTVEISSQPAPSDDVTWDDNCRRLTLPELEFPRPYRYAWAWNPSTNTLSIRISE
ncbi:MAG: hypothetical protein ACRERU_11525 [Methylococcales bacterium]